MASNALRSLGRTALLSRSQLTPAVTLATATASFTTTSASPAAQPSAGRRPMKRPIKKNFKKGKVVAKVQKPDPGERKAFRKRIVLSNNNALEVTGPLITELTPQVLRSEEAVGKMVKLSGDVIDRLRVLEAFKPTQGWGLFRSPHVLLRGQAVEVMKRLQTAREEKKVVRTLVAGEKVAGKSVLVLKALTYGLTNDWVVIHLPEAMELTNAHTEYSPLPGTSNPIQFYQPVYSLALIQRILAANDAILRTLPLQSAYPNLTPNLSHLTPGTSTLHDMLSSCKESEFAWTTLSIFWSELTTIPGRPPVLLSTDGAAHLMRMSEYRDPSFNLVHAHDLCLPRLFVDALAGRLPLINGGAVIAALSTSGRMINPSLDLKLAQGLAANKGDPVPRANPWERRYDERVKTALEDVEVLEVEKMSKTETRVLMEYWAASGLLREKVDETAVGEKWTLGAGILGEIEKMALRNMRM